MAPVASRYEVLDLWRGLIIVLMAIDHASYFIAKVHPAEYWGIPLPTYDSTLAFLTRFVTHLAAPGFFFLMGASVIFFAASRQTRDWSEGRIIRRLVTRGLVLILLQHLVENPAWLLGTLFIEEFAVPPPGGGEEVWLHFGVLYALGAAMILCSILLAVPSVLLIALGVGAILLTQILVPDPEQVSTLFSPLVRLIVIPGRTNIWQVIYPVLPWFGVAALGMAFARMMQRAPDRVVERAWIGGMGFLLVFVLLRVLGGFGNLHPVDGSGRIVFLNVTKYPPSLVFLLLTLGLSLILLSALNASNRWLQHRDFPLMVFGQSALAFYLLHLYVYAFIGFFFPEGSSWGMTYAMWLIGLVLLYPVCRRYRTFKKQMSPGSLWRLF